MKHPIDWKFLAICAFVTIGCVGGWMSILLAMRPAPVAAEPIPEIAPADECRAGAR